VRSLVAADLHVVDPCAVLCHLCVVRGCIVLGELNPELPAAHQEAAGFSPPAPAAGRARRQLPAFSTARVKAKAIISNGRGVPADPPRIRPPVAMRAGTWASRGGSSSQSHGGRRPWVSDYQAEVWLYLLAQQARAMADAPPWVAAAGSDWHAQATVGFMGCVSPCLDEHLQTDPGRVAVAIDLAGRALGRLMAWSPAIPRKVVNSFGTGGQEESFATDLAVGPLLACGRAFISLLRGELPPGYDRLAR
jgi:hypothetical protein